MPKRKTSQIVESAELTVLVKPAFRHVAGRFIEQTLIATDAVEIRLTVSLQHVTE